MRAGGSFYLVVVGVRQGVTGRKDSTTGRRKSPQGRTTKNRLLPYKILSLLLYGKYLWAELQPDGTLKVGLGPLARYVRTTPGRVKEQLEWLSERNYLDGVNFDHGLAYVALRPPPNFLVSEEATKAITIHRAEALEKVRRVIEETD